MDGSAVDHETRLEADDHFALKLWLRILTCSNLIESGSATTCAATSTAPCRASTCSRSSTAPTA